MLDAGRLAGHMLASQRTTMLQRNQIATSFLPVAGAPPAEWRVESAPVGYEDAVAFMEGRAAAIREGTAGELVWLVEHPPLYTGGTSAAPGDLLDADRFPVFKTGRGGE